MFLFSWRNFAAFLPPEMKRNIIVLQIQCFLKKKFAKVVNPENNLVKFGDILDMKVGKKKTEFFELLDYLLVLTIKIWQFGKKIF